MFQRNVLKCVQVHTAVKMFAHPRDRARNWTLFRLTALICSYQVSLHHHLPWVWVTTLLAVWLYKLSQFLTLHNSTLKTEVLCLSQMPTRLHCEIPNFILLYIIADTMLWFNFVISQFVCISSVAKHDNRLKRWAVLKCFVIGLERS